MPTPDWFKENPKVSAYISKDLESRLHEWMATRSIRKESQALTVILEEYLSGVVQPVNQSVDQSSQDYVTNNRFEALEGKSIA